MLWNSPSLKLGPPLRGLGHRRVRRGRVARVERGDEAIERRVAAHELALVGFERLARVREHARELGARRVGLR
jgi:hypothetical protein